METLNNEIMNCRRCPRLVAWREKVSVEKRKAFHEEKYWGKPVPGFGDDKARVFVVGLAPGAHGSNRTGRQFTGDGSGDFLFQSLFNAGFASKPQSVRRDDGLVLTDLYTAPVCRCVPPDNKPTSDEIENCRKYMELEIVTIQPQIFVALGKIAFESIIKILNGEPMNRIFSHGAIFSFPPGSSDNRRWLIASYHPSRQNTQTGRLSVGMFDKIWETVKEYLENPKSFDLKFKNGKSIYK